MKRFLILLFAATTLAPTMALAQNEEVGEIQETLSEEDIAVMTEQMRQAAIEDMKKNCLKIEKFSDGEDDFVATDIIAVDIFALRVYAASKLSLLISKDLLLVNDMLSGDAAISAKDILNGETFKRLQNNMKLQGENMIELGKLTPDAIKGVKEAPLKRKAMLALAIKPINSTSKLVISETKNNVAILKSLTEQIKSLDVQNLKVSR